MVKFCIREYFFLYNVAIIVDFRGEKFFSGCVFARPKETKHEQSRMFYKREVIAIEQPDRTVPFTSVQRRCAILTVKQFETCK